MGNNKLKSKLKQWIKVYKNSRLSAENIFDILFSDDFKSFESKILSFGYEQLGRKGKGGLNTFDFDTQNEEREQFYYYTGHSSINISCVSNKLKLKKNIEKEIENFVKKGILNFYSSEVKDNKEILKYDFTKKLSLQSNDGSNKLDTKITLELIKMIKTNKFTISSKIEWN